MTTYLRPTTERAGPEGAMAPSVSATGGPGPGAGSGGESRRGVWIALTIVGGVVALALIGVLGMTAWRVTSRPVATTTTSTSTTRPAAPTAPPTTAAPVVPPTNIATTAPPATNSTGLVRGLYCRDLAARGISYAGAVAYWMAEGNPDRMDADGNGIPCETVYPGSAVAAYWGDILNRGYAHGLTCANLADAGATYAEAVDYWFAEGMPERMDADRNGIPCETAYSPAEVADYWSGAD